jgi:4-amino-4-deoxy-L-arabinose transferase-like glycosyltransferase
MADRTAAARPNAVLHSAWLWVGLVYACGVAVRTMYTFAIQPPEQFVTSDMFFYVSLAQKFAATHGPVDPSDVTHPLGYPALIALLVSGGGSLARVVDLQLVVSVLVPPAVGLLAAAAYGRRTAQLAVIFASLYFPFIEYGALFLSEIHFILWLTLAFAVLFAARRVRRRAVRLALAAAAGVALSVAAAFKSVALPAAFLMAAVEGTALVVAPPTADAPTRVKRLQPWLLRWAVVAIAAAPLLAVQARACTRANAGHFCATGNKIGSDLLLGHYGRIGAMEWTAPGSDTARFGSPGSYLRRYEATARVPFAMSDSGANTREAWRWIVAHPGEAIVLSMDHIYDTFFGVAMWPGYGHPSWPLAHLSQYAFIAFLFIPLLPACAAILRRGARAAATSRTALMLAPVAALIITVAFATGEVRYRIPFDVFLMIVVCAYASGDLQRLDARAVP